MDDIDEHSVAGRNWGERTTPVDALTLYGDVVDVTAAVVAWEHLVGTLPYCVDRVEPSGVVSFADLELLISEDAGGLRLVRAKREHSNGNWSGAFMGEDAALSVSMRSGKVTACVYARSLQRATDLADLIAGVGSVVEIVEDGPCVDCDFVYRGEYRVVHTQRSIWVPEWNNIERNYERETGRALGELCAIERPEGPGRLILLHGPTGTGKTTAIRALIGAWSDWCSAVYVLDPDELFERSEYINELVVDQDVNGDKWMVLVIEDADAVIGKSDGGSKHLSRLLNLTDGLLGDDLRVLFVISTNEPLGALRDSMIRPGRCLAEVGVGKLPPSQARAWLGDASGGPIASDGATLAELFSMSGAFCQISGAKAPQSNVGQYL